MTAAVYGPVLRVTPLGRHGRGHAFDVAVFRHGFAEAQRQAHAARRRPVVAYFATGDAR